MAYFKLLNQNVPGRTQCEGPRTTEFQAGNPRSGSKTVTTVTQRFHYHISATVMQK